MRIRHPAWPLQAVLLAALALALGACRDKSQPQKRSEAPPGAKTRAPRGDSPLGRWLRRVPADARWAVVSADLHGLQRVLSHTAALLSHHKQLAPVLHRWRTRTEHTWGSWPLDSGSWDRLGLHRPSGGALYRRADGVTVALFHTRELARTLETIHQNIRRRGVRKITAVKPIRLAGKPAFRLDGWTCATRGKLSVCAQVAPDRFEATTSAPRRSLWNTPLGQVPGRYLQERLGVWIRASPHRGPGALATLQRGVTSLLSTPARGFWLALSLHRRLQLHAVAVTTLGVKPWASLPKPGHSGLAAARGAPLVVRLRLGPRRLGEQAQRLWPALKPVVALLGGRAGGGESLAEEMLNGEVVLISEHAGMAGILGLRSRARGQRAMKKLMLLLAPRLARWQKRVRAQGRGWDLTLTRANLGDVPTHRLTLQVPPRAGPGAPTLREGRLTLLWGIAKRHLVVATDANLFRRLLARLEQPDRSFLKALGDGAGRRGFREHRAVAVLLRPEDPLYALPPGQRTAARQWLEGLAPTAKGWATWIRTLVDLTDSATLSCEPLPVGIGCHLGIALLTEPGAPTAQGAQAASPAPRPHLTLDARYREALIKKWGGNREGYLRLVQALATAPTESPLRAKASRVLAHRRGVASSGLEGLWLSAWLPWARHRRATTARQEAPRELRRLTQALQRIADRARSLPPRQRKRWYRGLRSTKITPIRSCCVGGVRRCQSRKADWRHPTWRRLGFSLGGSHRYRYQLLWEPGAMRHRVVLRALGDYNCNGRSSLLQRVGIIDAATGALTVGPITRIRTDD